MESFFKKYGWIVHLVLIALISALLGVALNQVIAIQLAPFTVPQIADLSKASTATKTRPITRNKDLKRPIIQRCFFGCTDEPAADACPEGCAEGEVCQSGTCVALNTEVVDSEIPVASDMAVKLMGCMVARKSEYSLALMSEGAGKQTFIVGIGDQLMGEAEVLEIRRDRVIIRRNNRKEFIKLENSIGGNPSASKSAASFSPAAKDLKSPTRAPSPPPLSTGKAESAAKAKEGVTKTGENEYVIEKAALEDQLSDPKKMASQARIVPNYKNGKPSGIKLVGVNPGSVYSKIGIKSGDAIMAINGQKVTSQARALELLDGLRSASGAEITVERGGKRRSVSYKVK